MGRWITNTPRVMKLANFTTETGESGAEALSYYWAWRKRLIEGPPQATEEYTVEQLQQKGMIGLYAA